jgi:hypothetical protein
MGIQIQPATGIAAFPRASTAHKQPRDMRRIHVSSQMHVVARPSMAEADNNATTHAFLATIQGVGIQLMSVCPRLFLNILMH